MTTAISDPPIKWDHFLEDQNRLSVEGFRKMVWPNIKRELRKAGSDLPEGLEPCWVAPGRAIYWHKTTTRAPVDKIAEDGRPYREFEESDQGFGPTGELPANNHSVIANYLKKGFLLRPPGQEVVEEEDAVPQDGPTQNKQEYICYRHGTSRMAFGSWKAYILHLLRYKEAPEYDLPDEVKEHAKTFKFYCAVHNRGFNNPAHAARHMKAELKKPGKGMHPSMKDMDMRIKETVQT